MKKLLLLLTFIPCYTIAHPGVGIVKDSKGNLYYTDLKQVWKITDGRRTVVVPDVHTHELYVDQHDNLMGEGSLYDDEAEKFYQYLWVYRGSGKIDTVIGIRQAYTQHNFTLARDPAGNEYYLKRFIVPHTDTNRIYRRAPGGNETVFAIGNFKKVNWLHPQNNGTLLYASGNAIYQVDSNGKVSIVKDPVVNTPPTFPFSRDATTIWGVWQDNGNNVYAAVFSHQAIIKIDGTGNTLEVFRSAGEWTPLHGVFDNQNRLWVLETSTNHAFRVTMAGAEMANDPAKNNSTVGVLVYIIAGGVVVAGILVVKKILMLRPEQTTNYR